jgi:hypothetical protein
MIYLNEAHAKDVWPIGLSAGTINYSHKNLDDRASCANKFIQTFNFDIPTYMDSMDNQFDETFSACPFRYYVITWSESINQFIFAHIPNPTDGEFDLTRILEFC